ncbi:MAG: hypothetical protein ACRDT4_23435 [Micromonosporaceae bacterium]
MTVRHGYLARLGGVEYVANPATDGTVRLYAAEPADGFTEVRPGRYVRTVPAGDVDEVRYVRTTCRWRGAPCLVIGAHGDWLRLEYLGEDSAQAEQLGMDRFDVAVYQGWAPRSDVTELVEQLL